MKIDITKLVKLNEIAKEGSKTIARNLSIMLGIGVEMRISKIDFITTRDFPKEMDDGICVYLTFTGLPSGNLLVYFPHEGAKKVARLLLQGIESDSNRGFSEIEISAIKEIGNILTSSFIDGWANLLKTEIDISTPNLINASEIESILREMDEYAFVFSSHIYAKKEDIKCQIYVFPYINGMIEVLEKL
jgi:chemotaxis protein CheC